MRVCALERNQVTKEAIREDFLEGLRELDDEVLVGSNLLGVIGPNWSDINR